MTRAIVYVPPTNYEQSAARCLDYVQDRGYEFHGIVQDWDAAQGMIDNREVTVVIVADERDLDPNRKPRVEFVSHSPRPQNRARHWEQRTRFIRRNAAEQPAPPAAADQ